MGQREIQIIRDHKERPTLAGASSFTGMAILERLHARGWKPIGLTGTPLAEATGVKKWRLERLKSKGVDIVSGIRSEDGTMAQWVRHHRPKYWIHHFHHMDEFRSPKYDVKMALEVGLNPLELLIKELAQGGCRGLIHSGSYFEPGEGAQSISAKVTPYAETKRQIWLTLKELVDRNCVFISNCFNHRISIVQLA
ncbi:MAG: NAD-dependent epimerase/dehydratase family protein, partial [Bdellovibrionales bacterium]|nr:NAD-dependent epimerase/dehydratase family protein [Bdellovibrionales bacterium]